jgi:uncharacterized protein
VVGARGETDVRPVAEYVVKVTSRCDLACDHCYVYDDPQQAWARQPVRMEPGVAQLVATRIAEHADRHGLERVAVILHGGEPLLLGEARLLPILVALRSTIEPVATLDLRLQSNGTLLTPGLCESLVRHSVSVGVSLDGDRLANDRHRSYANGRSSHSRVLRGLALLRRPEFRSAYGGILCTVDVDNDPVRVYEALLRESPPRIDFLLPHATWDRPPPGRAYGEWLLRIHDRWEAEGKPVSIRLFESVHSLEQGGSSGTESLGVDNPTVAVIETDGTWELPDSLKTVSGDAPYTGLDLRHHSADDFVRHVSALRHGTRETPTACTSCPLLATCGGGLYAHRFGRGNGFDNPSVYCADLARLIVGMRYRQRAATRLAATEPPWTVTRDAAAVATCSARRLLEDGADPAAPEVINGLVRREHEFDRELMFTLATMAGKDHGRAAWQLLVDVEAAAPETVVSTLAYPYVRRRVRHALAAAQPAGATACRSVLAVVAIAAAVRAGHPGSLDVPVVEGALCLPGLGVLALPEASVARVSSSARPGEFAVHPDLGLSWISTESGPAQWWRPVLPVDTGRPGMWFDDVDPARDCYAHPVAERLTSAERDTRVAMVERAWSSVRLVAPQLAAALDMMITTVTPLASRPQTDPPTPGTPEAVFGAVAIPMVEADATAVTLVEHAARSIITTAHSAFGVASTHRTRGAAAQAPSTLADAYAVVASLRLAEGRRRCGKPVDDRWVTAQQKQLRRHLDDATRHDQWTKLGRLLLDHMDAVR